MSDDIDVLAAVFHVDEPDPIEVAVTRLTILVEVRDEIRANRPPELPRLLAWPDLSAETVARKVIASLLDAGWSPPTPDEIAVAVTRTLEYRRRFAGWKATYSPDLWAQLIEHHSQTGEYPPGHQPPPETEARAGAAS